MVELGTYYYDENTFFPAVVIKSLEGESVMVRVWTTRGDQTQIATRSLNPGASVFVAG